MPLKPCILLSFDVEEFDMPLEYGQLISEKEQLQTGYEGLKVLLDLIEPSVQATFFTTANFAEHFPDLIRTISTSHEIASHTFFHSHFKNDDLFNSRKSLEQIISKPVKGLRMPRMKKVEALDVLNAGYQYDSSVNPTCIPGRYNNLGLPRKIYHEQGLLRLPVSVTPVFRLPLFWLAFKNFPYAFYLNLAKKCLKNDGYLCLYFHPWEFVELDHYKIPAYTKKLAGKKLQERFQHLIKDLKPYGDFTTVNHYLENHLHKHENLQRD